MKNFESEASLFNEVFLKDNLCCHVSITVNSLVSDHPLGTAKWSLMGGSRLRERSPKQA